MLLKRRDLAAAAQSFAEARERGPTWADPIKGEGDVLAARGRWSEAIRAYRKAVVQAPRWAALHLALAEALAAKGQRDKALAAVNAARGMAPSPGETASLDRLRQRLRG